MKKKVIFFILYGCAIIQLGVVGLEGIKERKSVEVFNSSVSQERPVGDFFDKINSIDGAEVEEVRVEAGENIGVVKITGNEREIKENLKKFEVYNVQKFAIDGEKGKLNVKLEIKEE